MDEEIKRLKSELTAATDLAIAAAADAREASLIAKTMLALLVKTGEIDVDAFMTALRPLAADQPEVLAGELIERAENLYAMLLAVLGSNHKP